MRSSFSLSLILLLMVVHHPASAFVPLLRPTTTTTTTNTQLSAADVTPTPMAPLTSWGEPYPDIVATQKASQQVDLPEFAPELSAQSLGLTTVADELTYFKEHGAALLDRMQAHGAVVLRDFQLTKTPEGFTQFYEAVGLRTCLDPLHSVSARPTIAGSPVYEAVNKESRKNFFIGMHNEFVGTRAPRAAAFCCFQAATTGGEFLIADGRRIFRDLPADLLQQLYQRQIRYSVMELPFFTWIDGMPEFLREPVSGAVQTIVSAAINAKVDFSVQMQWGTSDYDQARMLQARAPRQPPVVAHPVTGEPSWFCNVHSHSSVLRQKREEIYGAERFEDGASRINKSDMFFGDDSELTLEQLQTLDEVTMKHVRFCKMTPGDVVLLDNYKTMHGRNVFDGKRKHGVCWFEGWEGEERQKQQANAQSTPQTVSA